MQLLVQLSVQLSVQLLAQLSVHLSAIVFAVQLPHTCCRFLLYGVEQLTVIWASISKKHNAFIIYIY